jgi:hypothetical protein
MYPSVCPCSVSILDVRSGDHRVGRDGWGCAAISDPQQTRDFFAQGQSYYRSRRIAVAMPLDIAVAMPLDIAVTVPLDAG